MYRIPVTNVSSTTKIEATMNHVNAGMAILSAGSGREHRQLTLDLLQHDQNLLTILLSPKIFPC